MRRVFFICLAGSVQLAQLHACAIDSVPLPEGTQAMAEIDRGNAQPPAEPDAASGYVHPDALYWVQTPGLLAGDQGCVPPGVALAISNLDLGDFTPATGAADGSFTVLLGAQPGHTIRVRLIDEPEVFAQIVLGGASADAEDQTTNLVDAGAVPAPPVDDDRTSHIVLVSAPDAAGLATVSGSVRDGVAAGLRVVVANDTAGTAATTDMAEDGSFSVAIAASTGDQLYVFVVSPSDSHTAAGSLALTVP